MPRKLKGGYRTKYGSMLYERATVTPPRRTELPRLSEIVNASPRVLRCKRERSSIEKFVRRRTNGPPAGREKLLNSRLPRTLVPVSPNNAVWPPPVVAE